MRLVPVFQRFPMKGCVMKGDHLGEQDFSDGGEMIFEVLSYEKETIGRAARTFELIWVFQQALL